MSIDSLAKLRNVDWNIWYKYYTSYTFKEWLRRNVMKCLVKVYIEFWLKCISFYVLIRISMEIAEWRSWIKCIL